MHASAPSLWLVFFFNDTATTEIYTLSLHDALPIFRSARHGSGPVLRKSLSAGGQHPRSHGDPCLRGDSLENLPHVSILMQQWRSEEHTSELQSRQYLVCRLLLEKKKRAR